MAYPEPEQRKRAPGRGRLVTGRRLVVAACLLALAAVACVLLLRPGRSAGSRLQALDAAHAVPDEENAARDYMRLALDGTAAFLDPQFLAQNVQTTTLAQPWRSADFPEVTKWIQERQTVIDALLQAGRKPKCWFHLYDPQRQGSTRWQMAHYGTLLLLRAANNDFADGHAEAGLEKLMCVFQMAGHFSSQIDRSDYDTGMTIQSEGLKVLARLAVREDVPREWLSRFDAALSHTEDIGDRKRRQMYEVEELHVRQHMDFRYHVMFMFVRGSRQREMKRMDAAYLAEAQAARILLALRQEKDAKGAWPATLAEIKGQIPPEVLIDPLTKKPFVYHPGGDSLILYNVGPNGIDEGGWSGSDDYWFWPPSSRWVGSVKY